jgi:hypothetical protein
MATERTMRPSLSKNSSQKKSRLTQGPEEKWIVNMSKSNQLHERLYFQSSSQKAARQKESQRLYFN